MIFPGIVAHVFVRMEPNLCPEVQTCAYLHKKVSNNIIFFLHKEIFVSKRLVHELQNFLDNTVKIARNGMPFKVKKHAVAI